MTIMANPFLRRATEYVRDDASLPRACQSGSTDRFFGEE